MNYRKGQILFSTEDINDFVLLLNSDVIIFDDNFFEDAFGEIGFWNCICFSRKDGFNFESSIAIDQLEQFWNSK